MRASLLLFFLLTTTTMATINQSNFRQQNVEFLFNMFKDYKVIQEPNHPIFYQGMAFYWYGAYVPSAERPQSCIIFASHPDWPFDGNVFRNGTIPTAAVFGCQAGKMCQGTKCVEPLTHFNVVTYTLVGVVIILIICLLGGESRAAKRNQQAEPPRGATEVFERPRRRAPRDPSFDNMFSPPPSMPRDNRVRFMSPPEYTE
ncbi:hypothetical protein L5515_006141 [Caenorhabditis briggsae]|uniref:CX domain-containing protein n=1 Tax=Caenorhabditis briggsae TaxID=6238 RepID=A0AAE9F1U6_CAEBR|nr:hypothetical protein L5515_006141 [Caenorhabditis briggsae]